MSMSKREALRHKREQAQKRQRTIVIVVVVLAAVGLAALFIGPNVIASMTPIGPITQITPAAYPTASGLSLGDPNAPVKLVEYADFQCPFCGEFAKDFAPSIIEKYVASGQVYFTYATDSFIGPESAAAAEAAYCANDQGKFWPYHDMLFANQTTENSGDFSDRRLKAFAQTLGLDMGKFNSCYDSHKYQSQVQQDSVKANQAGVTATPSFTINGQLVDLNNDMANVEKYIQLALGGTPVPTVPTPTP